MITAFVKHTLDGGEGEEGLGVGTVGTMGERNGRGGTEKGKLGI